MMKLLDTEQDYAIRRATPADALILAQLVNIAGEGFPLYFWEKSAGPGETGWDVGRRRALREDGGFSYLHAFILETGGVPAGCLIGYALPPEPEPVDHAEMPPIFVPLQELEQVASGTWYVNVLAMFEHARNRGYGRRLLQEAEKIAAGQGISDMSIIVSNANLGARRLYERCGYVEIASRPMVKEDWDNPGENWILLIKD